MPKQFELSTEVAHSIERVHAALIDERYWRYRLREDTTNSVTAEFDESGGPGTLTVTVIQTSDGSNLPGFLRAVVSLPMQMKRVDTWGPLRGERAEGTLSGTSTGFPLAIDGTLVLRSTGDRTVIDLQGRIAVKVRLVGGQIEAMLKQMVAKSLERDRDEIIGWLELEG